MDTAIGQEAKTSDVCEPCGKKSAVCCSKYHLSLHGVMLDRHEGRWGGHVHRALAWIQQVFANERNTFLAHEHGENGLVKQCSAKVL